MRDGDRRGFESGTGTPFGGGRHRTNGTNGAHPEGMNTRPAALDDFEEPIDLVAVQADDELINALATGMSVTAPGLSGYDAEDHVAAILAAWKADVDSEPIPELIDVDTAVAAVKAGRAPSRRTRHLAPIAAAAAFLVLVIGGVSVGSATSEPGDALWAVSKVLYSERAESVEAVDRVETRLANAKQALVSGHPDIAADELEQAKADLAVVRLEEGLAELAEVQDFLVAKAEETPEGVPTDPGAPLATAPARKVPAGAAITEETQPPSTTQSTTVAPVPPGPVTSVDPAPSPSGPAPSSPQETVPPNVSSTNAPTPTSPGGTTSPTVEGSADASVSGQGTPTASGAGSSTASATS